MSSLKRKLIRLAERSGMRPALAVLGSWAARRITGQDVALFFDDIWIRRVGDRCFGDKSKFDYYMDEFKAWNDVHALWTNDPVDCWLYDYEPAHGDTVIDIGAGFGNDAVVFSRAVGPTGKVVAIEAHPVSFRKLLKTCKWSGLSNVVPIEVAVSEENGTAAITGDDDDVGNAIGGGPDLSAYTYEVTARRFDDLADEMRIGPIALLKMNIEGAERGALLGMSKTLQRTERVAIACHDFRAMRGESEFFRTREFVRRLLEQAGFRLKFRDGDPRPYVADTIYGARKRG